MKYKYYILRVVPENINSVEISGFTVLSMRHASKMRSPVTNAKTTEYHVIPHPCTIRHFTVFQPRLSRIYHRQPPPAFVRRKLRNEQFAEFTKPFVAAGPSDDAAYILVLLLIYSKFSPVLLVLFNVVAQHRNVSERNSSWLHTDLIRINTFQQTSYSKWFKFGPQHRYNAYLHHQPRCLSQVAEHVSLTNKLTNPAARFTLTKTLAW